MFHVGQMVECIREDGAMSVWDTPLFPNLPVSGGVYTIRDVTYSATHGGCVRLREIVNPMCPVRGTEGVFVFRFFRPLQDSKLEVFRALLVNLPAPPVFKPERV